MPIYPTNSPEECEWVAGNSESRRHRLRGRRADREDPRGPRRTCRSCKSIIVDRRRRRHRRRDPARRHPRPRPRARRGRADRAPRRRHARRTRYTFIYTSGTTGPPKGCVLSHRNYRSVLDMVNERGLLAAEGDVVYLYLPLAHVFAQLIQLGAVRHSATTIAYFGGDTKQIIPELEQVKPDYLPSVPRIFEKLYTLAHGGRSARALERSRRAVELGVEDPRPASIRGEPVPPGARASASIRPTSRAASRNGARALRRQPARGRHRRRADRRRDPRVLLRRGRPGHGGLRHDGDRDGRRRPPTPTQLRFGTVGRPLPGVEVRIAEDGEILIGRRTSSRATGRTTRPAVGSTTTAGCTPATSASSTRTASSPSPAARRTSSSPRAARTSRRPTSRTTSSSPAGSRQAVMYGDRRPYPGRAHHARRGGDRPVGPGAAACPRTRRRGARRARRRSTRSSRPSSTAPTPSTRRSSRSRASRSSITTSSQETGELTPTLKVKRNVVYEKYADALRRPVRGLRCGAVRPIGRAARTLFRREDGSDRQRRALRRPPAGHEARQVRRGADPRHPVRAARATGRSRRGSSA